MPRKKIKLTIDLDTGRIDPPVDDNENALPLADWNKIIAAYNSTEGLRFSGLVVQGRENPTCSYVIIGGKPYKICG
jgi:hypothetical protein